ncbi:NAD-dependent epimerase/dehydratase family protein [Micromonospora zingiberis]|uniref:NAD-dependent epimerase/dehydratase family protein n=1 Tax=Micromonospora zingiberis TaxID=2053011 RepID=A0A4R0GNR5_9ACTN|nr:NAD-dependent epimerase/dehydratase family protein [Micromonospora zingiberis]TCB97211.1 NAD-dependent epimerase/dehydratase family protein [Micromonospora zingiberis]
MTKRTVLVVGASGLVGRASVDTFLDHDWDVVAVSRRPPEVISERPFRHLPVDLTDAPATTAALQALPEVSHLVYAAAFEKSSLVAGWSDPHQMATNRTMLDNVLRPLVTHTRLQHVTLMQGTKAYGVHLHPIPLPARERHPRDEHPNFYWLQEDLLRETAERHGLAWTIFRPVQVVGPAYGVAYCTPPVIGVLAAICHEEGLPFGFPGGATFPVKQAADVRLVADAIRWATDTPAAWGGHFNLTNGEVFSWQELWPLFGEVMGVQVDEPHPQPLGPLLATKGDQWTRIVHRYGLRPMTLDDVLGQSHLYADYTFGTGLTEPPPPALVSTVKVKQAGFTEVRDTEDTFRWSLRTLIDRRVLPDLRRST